MKQNNIDVEDSVTHLEAVMFAYELENPDLAESIQILGIAIDEYERLLAESEGPQFETSNNTSG